MRNKLILGTVQFGLDYGINNKLGKPSDDEVEKILLSAYKNNVMFLDTAEAYGDSQIRIGQFHLKHPEIIFNVITKYKENNKFNNIKQNILADIQELSVKKLYAYLFHNLNDLRKQHAEIDELIVLKEKGLINKIGVSLYTNDEIEEVLNKYDFVDLIQIPYNLFDNFQQREAVLVKMKNRGIEVHTRSAFLQGLFFKNKMPDKLSLLQPYINVLHELSRKHSLSISELALNYCLNQPLIDKVLIGVDTENQLNENINSIKKINCETIYKINEIDIKDKQLLNPALWKK